MGHAPWRWRDPRWQEQGEERAAAAFGPSFYFHLFIQVERSEAHVLVEQTKL